MVDKNIVEKTLATIMDQIPEVEGLIAADYKGNVITGQTLTAMDHNTIVKKTLSIVSSSKELSTQIEKSSVTEIRIASEEGFVLIVCGKEIVFIAITGTDAASSLGLVVRNLIVALKNF